MMVIMIYIIDFSAKKSCSLVVDYPSFGGIHYRVIRNYCRGFNNLPPRSPDATPCDFFLWGYVKDQV